MQTTNKPLFIRTVTVPAVTVTKSNVSKVRTIMFPAVTVPTDKILIPKVPTVTNREAAIATITPLGNGKAQVPVIADILNPKAHVMVTQVQVPAFFMEGNDFLVQSVKNGAGASSRTAESPKGILTPTAATVPETLTEKRTLNVQPRVPSTTGINEVHITTPVLMQPHVKDIELREWQVNWAHRAHSILLRNHGYIDTSRMRSGKTYVTMWLAKKLGFRLLVVCPVGVMDVWRRTAAEYAVEIIDIISYQSLRSQKNRQPKHGYLYRHDNITGGRVHQVNFSPTRAYNDLVEQGIMVVCDEIQNIKNNSAQYKACNVMIRSIICAGGRSRFALLSGTPFDKEEHAVNLLKLIGYIRSFRLYYYVRESRELVLEGIQELIDACRFINTEETERVMAKIRLVKGNMKHLCYSLYTRVVKTSISGAMTAPTNITGRYDVKNGFYDITQEREMQLGKAIDDLAKAVGFNERTGTAKIRSDNIGEVTTALVHIENAKVDDFARVATHILTQNPRNKVVISVNYTNTINQIIALMVVYNPLILYGKVPSKKRGGIISSFTNDPTRRLLIMNTAVGGVGISLYSTNPESPIWMLMSPSYKLLEVTQAAARIYGPGMISDAFVRVFYGSGDAGRETGILTAIARKTQVLKGTLEDVVTRDLVLPGDYKAEEERCV